MEIPHFEQSKLGDYVEFIFPSQISNKKLLIERSLLEIGEMKGLSREASLGNYSYSFWNTNDPRLINKSVWLALFKNNRVETLVNIHIGKDLAHYRYFIHTAAISEALAIIPELTQYVPADVNTFRFVVPVPSRDYPDSMIQERLNKVGFVQKRDAVTVAQMCWPDPSSFKYYDKVPDEDLLIDPLPINFIDKAEALYAENYDINSFKGRELTLGLHKGLSDIATNPINQQLVAIVGRTQVIKSTIEKGDKSFYKVAILRDAVVGKSYRRGGRAMYLTSLLAREAYCEGAHILALDATTEAAEKEVMKLGATLSEYRRWYIAERKTNENYSALDE